MKVAIIAALFISPAALHFFGKPALAWFSENPTLHTQTFGYMPWVIIISLSLLSRKISNRLKL